jgi:hypothetical protein
VTISVMRDGVTCFTGVTIWATGGVTGVIAASAAGAGGTAPCAFSRLRALYALSRSAGVSGFLRRVMMSAEIISRVGSVGDRPGGVLRARRRAACFRRRS